MRFGTAEAAAGELATGWLHLTDDPLGPVVSPVMLARGARPGPRLLVTCLIHGGENGGPVALARFLRRLDLGELRGSIAGLMCANPLAQRQHSRLTPQDGMNLNRVFPGNPAGTVTEQLAHRLLEIARAEGGDAVLDLHSGGELTITAFYAIHDARGEGEAEREGARLAASSGSRLLWASREAWLDGAFFAAVSRRLRIPAIIVESGGGARVTEQDLAHFETALAGLARALGMLPGEPPEAAGIRRGGNAVHVKCTRGGIWNPAVAPGEDITAGQVMGEILSPTGEVLETIRCPLGQAWVGSIRRPWMPLYAGEQVVEAVERL